jgi:hypothetical protein
VPFEYIWGDALDTIRALRPDAWIINLETAVTRVDDPWPKGINYRMNPDNVPCVAAAGIDCCVLANNHVLDWGRDGLLETLEVLHRAGLKTTGAGRNLEEASAPAIVQLPDDRRALVYAFACPSSGVPNEWAATADRPGVNLLDDDSEAAIDQLGEKMVRERRRGDVAVCSLHWGANWGYTIPSRERSLARGLIDRAGVDVVFGHSSHHPKAIEVYRGKPIFYGCGDFSTSAQEASSRSISRPTSATGRSRWGLCGSSTNCWPTASSMPFGAWWFRYSSGLTIVRFRRAATSPFSPMRWLSVSSARPFAPAIRRMCGINILGLVPAELGHLPQYASLFVIGIVAGRGGWFTKVTPATGKLWFAVGVAAFVAAMAFYAAPGSLPAFVNLQVAWGFLEAFVCVGMILGRTVLFRHNCATPGRLAGASRP